MLSWFYIKINLLCFVGSENSPLTGGVISSRDINSPAVKNRTTQPPQPAPRSTVESQSKRAQDQSAMPIVRKKDREYLGMIEYRKEDEQIIVSRLVNGKLTTHFKHQALIFYPVSIFCKLIFLTLQYLYLFLLQI